ncbi:MAG: glycosyltransferase [Desulfobulbaceae bacterium]|nr:glycosyltransferase [Desulfobulbaceae bacterium]
MIEVLQFIAAATFGGLEKAFVELTNALADHARVTALIPRGAEYRHRFATWVPVIELKSHPTRHNPLLWLELRRLLKARNPDIIHTHSAKAAELVDLVNRDRGFVHFATKHNDRKESIFNSLPLVSTVSEKGLASVCPQKNGKIWVIHNGVNVEPVERGPLPEIFTMLAVGRLDVIKGFDQLIKAVAGLDFPFCLRIVGEGPERLRLEKGIRALHLEGKVFLEGFREDIHQMMADSHLVVISSRREGGPRILPESLFYAPMLISTPVGMVPEILPPDFQCGLADMRWKITDVCLNYARYQRLFTQIADRERNNFHLPVIARKYLNVYAEILDTTSSSRESAQTEENNHQS